MATKKPFFWGASTASHQVEGGTVNQWSVWELSVAAEQAKTAKQRLDWLPNWKDIEKQATDPHNYVSGKGVDHYNRFEEDFDILKKLNLNAFRFTIEWSRIEPEEGKFDLKEIEHYKNYIAELRKRGIEPFLNIWHWTVPVWFEEAGGFTKHSNLKKFYRFVEIIAKELTKDVDYVITLNEPNVYTSFSYVTGEWPPQEKNSIKGLRAYYNLAIAHKKAYKILKKHKPGLHIGVAQQLADIQPYTQDNMLDEISTKIMRYGWNWWWLNRIKRYQDFVGFNYYFTDYYKKWHRTNPKEPVSDLGWYMEPGGILPLMRKINKHYPGVPIVITENGLADANDKQRKWWIEETMRVLDTARSENLPVIGYLHWSLLDNFEWAYGWWPKFGLVEVDRDNNMKRTIRPSAKWWAEELKRRGN
jgi:beta-glucosidase